MSWFSQFFTPTEFSQTHFSDEQLEEYRMVSAFRVNEIIRLHRCFLDITGGIEFMSKGLFVSMESICENPLLDRICLCFGYTDLVDELDFKGFLVGVAAFNSPGLKVQKLRIAFRIQDFDDDGVINKSDLTTYLNRITESSLKPTEIEQLVEEIMKETGNSQEVITFTDFQRVVAPKDFQANLLLPI